MCFWKVNMKSIFVVDLIKKNTKSEIQLNSQKEEYAHHM